LQKCLYVINKFFGKTIIPLFLLCPLFVKEKETIRYFRNSFLIAVRSGRGPHWGAEPRFDLGAALQQPDALLTEPLRTLLSHAAPCLATPHPNEPRRILNSW
jgi:hypothetical protein